jgi:hypothetical protein
MTDPYIDLIQQLTSAGITAEWDVDTLRLTFASRRSFEIAPLGYDNPTVEVREITADPPQPEGA